MLTSLLLAAAAVATTAPVMRDSAVFEQSIVQMHDEERARVGSPPIEWDASLARDAAQWAEHLADIDDLVHWGEENDDNGQGENLWLGTKGAFGLRQMIGGWSGEKRDLARMSSWEDDYEKVGHYTQMVWAGTRKVGCAVRANRSDEVLVCRYWPAGNVIGEQPYGEDARVRPQEIASID